MAEPAGAEPGGTEPGVRVDARKLEAALLELRRPVVSLPLALECPGVEQARSARRKVLSQIDDYLLPRLRQPGAPILIAMVGSTGAGKSTLMNSVVGQQVSATGIRRPTTNSPVLACHPDDAGWFAENVFLPTLPRVRQQGLAMPGRDGLLVLAASDRLPVGVALLDTPDIDSVVAAHREFASQFLDASDLFLFITTARRYADAAVWELLKDARDRGAALTIVLSRVPASAVQQLTAHFDAMLAANGLGDVHRFVITETTVTSSMLPAGESEPVRQWLADTARRDDRRISILTQTMSGVLDTFKARIAELAAAAEAQLATAAELRSAADVGYEAALAELAVATSNGSLLRGEVLARWQDFAGNADLLRTVETRKAPRQAGRSAKRALPARSEALKTAVRSSLTALIIALADRAAEAAVGHWQAGAAGAALLARAEAADAAEAPAAAGQSGQPDWDGRTDTGLPEPDADRAAGAPAAAGAGLGRSSDDLPGNAARAVSDWQKQLLHLVRTGNLTKRSIARVARFDGEALALVLTVGLLGYGSGEPAASQDAGAVPHQLLGTLFGAGLMRDMSARARQQLTEQVGLAYAAESRRFTSLLDAVEMPETTIATQLYQAGFALESAR